MVSCALFVFDLVKTEPSSALAWRELVQFRVLWHVNFRKMRLPLNLVTKNESFTLILLITSYALRISFTFKLYEVFYDANICGMVMIMVHVLTACWNFRRLLHVRELQLIQKSLEAVSLKQTVQFIGQIAVNSNGNVILNKNKTFHFHVLTLTQGSSNQKHIKIWCTLLIKVTVFILLSQRSETNSLDTWAIKSLL
jgi:hypothetical protein